MASRVGIGVAGEHDLGAQIADRQDLDFGGRLRHHDHRVESEMPRGERHALRVIARARRDHAAFAFGIGQMRDAVVGATQFEAENRLQILTFEPDVVA